MVYYVYMHNKRDSDDDDVLKINAPNARRAKIAAERYATHKFNVGIAYKPKAFRNFDPDWYSLLSGTNPIR